MALPKIQHRLYKHTLAGLKKDVSFRPFTVAEQKIMLLAKEESKNEEMKNGVTESVLGSVKQVLENCTLGKIDVDKLPTFDLEDLFLRIRSKSVGEMIKIRYAEHYKDAEDRPQTNFIEVPVNLDEVKVTFPEGHSNVIQITDSIGITMKYPTFEMLSRCKTSDELTIECIDTIFEANEVHDASQATKEELEEFFADIEQGPMLEVQKFFSTMPKLSHQVTVKLHNGEDHVIHFEGLQSFFS